MTDGTFGSDHQRFSVGDQPRIMASGGAATITTTTGDDGVVEVYFPAGGSDRYRIQQRGDRITIRPVDRHMMRSQIAIELIVPPGTDLKLSTASGDIEVLGRAGDVDVSIASGDVHVDGATGDVRVKSASGDVEVGDSRGLVDVTTASGDVRLGAIGGEVNIATASGDVRLAKVEDICSINSVSGDVSVHECDATDISVRTMSGDVMVGLPARRKIELDFESVAGDVRNDLSSGRGGPPERTIALRCRSVTGDLTLRSCE